jgi:hypothetical protein
MKKITLFLLAASLSLAACERFFGEENPPAEGFRAEASDERAIALADSVMQALGGRRAWDNTRYLSWNFFGARRLLWDKDKQRVRIEVPEDFSIYLIDLEHASGRIMRYGEELTHPDSLAKYVERGRQIWVNDSYWLFMPFKLKDSGVTLKYVGEDTMQGGAPAEVLELRFEEVGFTPENKYRIYIDPQEHLVKQWAFYRQAANEQPDFITPWSDYQQYGQIKLAGDRGERDISEIAVHDKVPDEAFTSFEYQFKW